MNLPTLWHEGMLAMAAPTRQNCGNDPSMKLKKDAKYARWNHAALIATADGGLAICSGLVARCLKRTSIIFDSAASNISPADLAKQFEVNPEQAPIVLPPGD